MNRSAMEKELQDMINPILGAVLAENVTAKRLELVVEVNNPAWAAQVESIKDNLLATFNAALPMPISDIKIKVRRTGSDAG